MKSWLVHKPVHRIIFNALTIALLAPLMCVVFISTGFAAKHTWTGDLSNEWGTPGNWDLNSVPGSGDDVDIPTSPSGGRFPIISDDSNFAIRKFVIKRGATITQTGGTLEINDFKSAAGGGTYNQQDGLIKIGHDWKQGGTFNASGGTVQFIGTGGRPDFAKGTNQFFNVIVDDGQDPKFDKKANSSILIAGNFTNNNTSLNVGTNATFTFNGTGDQTITSVSTAGSATFGHFAINKTSGQVSLGSNIEVSGNVALTSGNFATGPNTLTLSGTADQTITWSDSNATFGHLEINKTSGQASLGSNIEISANTTVSNGTLDCGTNVLSGSGDFTLSSGATLGIGSADGITSSGATGNIQVTGSRTFSTGANYIYNGSSAQSTGGGLPSSVNELTIKNSGGEVSLANNVTVSGTLFFTQGSINLNSNTLSYGANALLAYNGTTAQTTSDNEFPSTNGPDGLVIDNASGVTLHADRTISDTLALTSGNFATGSNTLTLGTSTSSLGSLSRNSGTIVGRLKRWFAASTATDVLFPVGTSSYYRPANISFTSAPTTGGTLTTLFESTDPGDAGLPLDDGGTSIVNSAAEGCWTMSSADGLTGGTYSLDLTADGFGGVSDYTTLRICKRADSLSTWTLDGVHSAGTGSNGTPVVHRTGMSGFSQFGIGGASDNPLPIQLAYFNASVVSNSNNVLLTWRTITETNNYGFYTQQRVDNTSSFVDLPNSFVPGQGTTLIPHDYSWTHQSVSPGTYYYRLKQVDLDGTTHYTDAVQVIVDGVTGVDSKTVPEVFSLAQNYPNPFNPSTTISFTVEVGGHTTLTVFNALGQEIATLFSGEAESGQVYTVQFDATNLANGMYFYKLMSNDKSSIRKMILLK